MIGAPGSAENSWNYECRTAERTTTAGERGTPDGSRRAATASRGWGSCCARVMDGRSLHGKRCRASTRKWTTGMSSSANRTALGSRSSRDAPVMFNCCTRRAASARAHRCGSRGR